MQAIMQWARFFALGCCSTALFACAPFPKFENSTAPDAACIRGDLANAVRFFSEGEAHVQIQEIDGVPTPGWYGPFCLEPGRRQLGLTCVHYHSMAKEYWEFDFAPGRQYRLRGHLRRAGMAVNLFDVTSQPPLQVAAFTMELIQPNEWYLVPIPVP